MSWNRIYTTSPVAKQNLKARIIICWILVIFSLLSSITLLVMNPLCILGVIKHQLSFKLWIIVLDIVLAVVMIFIYYILYLWMNMSGFNNWYQQTYFKKWNDKFLDDFWVFFIYFFLVLLSMGFLMFLYTIQFSITLYRYNKIKVKMYKQKQQITKSMQTFDETFKASRFIKA